MLKKFSFVLAVILSAGILTSPAFANKSKATIEAPDSAVKGDVITIKVNVTHSANSFIHHTNWVYVMVGGNEIARWDFSASDLPESKVFSREVKYTVEGPVTIKAEANCNIHGSAGLAEKKLEIK